MTMRTKILQEIFEKMNKIPDNKLKDILKYIEQVEDPEKTKDNILSFAGKWNGLGEDFFNNLTENLHKNRDLDNRLIS